MTTIHSNTSRDALLRLETMISLSGITIQEKAMRQMISSSIDIIIQLVRHSDGCRRIVPLPKSPAWRAASSACKTFLSLSVMGLMRMAIFRVGTRPPESAPGLRERCRVFGAALPE